MLSQEQNAHFRMYCSWLIGHHAYKDVFSPEIGKVLALQREPENGIDRNAVAVIEENGRIVGHILFGLSQIVSSVLKREYNSGVAVICGKRVNRGAGLGLEIPVMFKFYGKADFLERLDILIKSSETAKKALRLESEGISSEESLKRPPGKHKSVAKNQHRAKSPRK